MDAADPSHRDAFHIPPSTADPAAASIYLCGNSLGLMPKATGPAVEQFMKDWARFGVEGHFDAQESWYDFHEPLREPLAAMVGAKPHEVVTMNTLTVNLHLLLVSFYRPTPTRYKILIDGPCFPSDVYAVKSQARAHGFDPDDAILWVRPRDGEHSIRTEDIESMIAEHGDEIAVVMLAAVNYYSGQHYDMPRITAAGHAAGCIVGWDCAHGFGNVPLNLHDCGADFGAWCHYKYGNAGPGAIAGAFVHERWVRDAPMEAFAAMPRYEGWWGNDPDTRFQMGPDFTPVRSADAWALSNPPILSLLPVRVSLDVFTTAGFESLRERSMRLTAYLQSLIDDLAIPEDKLTIITPRDPASRGCQLSMLLPGSGRAFFDALQAAGVICDYREPDVIRIAPTPLYNTYHDCWMFAQILRRTLQQDGVIA